MTNESKIEFSYMLNNLEHGEATTIDLSNIFYLTRLCKQDLPDDVKKELFTIGRNILINDCVLKCSEKDWASKNGDYFSGNCNDESVSKWHDLFLTHEFSLSDMVNYTDFILSDVSLFNSDFFLRNPEVTLRDHVKIVSPDFREKQIAYAHKIKNLLSPFL